MTAADSPDGGGQGAPPDSVDLAEDFRASGVGEVLAELDRDLVGLKPIKQRIRETAALLLVDRARQRLGLTQTTPTLHMSFTGNPGTGKTTVALRMADLLYRLGYVLVAGSAIFTGRATMYAQNIAAIRGAADAARPA